MLAGAEPRGLPGTAIDRVAFQRAAEGNPLDDVIVYAHDAQGKPATLEIQVKRGVTFAPGDKVFRSVVGQIAEASRKPEFLTTRYEMGIAISRSSHKIDGPYQDVLTWARQIGDAATFISRINRPGSAHDSMRGFVNTFRAHLKHAGAPHDDQTVWQLLRRFQIFVFDFTAAGSASEELAKERAVRALHAEDGLRAADFWKHLTELAISIASSGGDRTRSQLIADVTQRGFRLAGDRHNLPARQALAEASRHALTDIGDRVGGVMLTRHERVSAVHSALDTGRYVEIRGNAGVGKSGVLKHFAGQISAEAAVIVLSPNRAVPKGWLALRSVLGFDGSAHDLLSDVAASGSAVLFVDNLDFFGAEERTTVIDLVREAATVPGMAVIVTARRDFGTAEPNWLPADALDRLGRAESVIIDELSDSETNDLRNAAPLLAALLSDGHPARDVARNLFRLSRLVNRPTEALVLRTEAEMAEEWWQSADGARDGGHRERARVLAALAEQALSRADPLMVAGQPAAAVDALIASETLRDLGNDRVVFRHDVLREWAIGNLLHLDASLIGRLPLDRPAPPDLARGIEMAARLAIERTPDAERWRALYAAVTKSGVNESWGRAVLLALVRSEIAVELLDNVSALLFADRAKVLRDLIRITTAVESEPAGKYYGALGIDPRKIPAGINVPAGPAWTRLILWLLKLGVGIPAPAIPDAVSLCTNWSIVWGGRDPFRPRLVQWLYYWLTQIERSREASEKPEPPFGGELTGQELGNLAENLKTGFVLFCNQTPDLAAEYLKSLKNRRYRDHELRSLMKFRGTLAQAAPRELAAVTAEYLLPKEQEEDEEDSGPFRDAFGHVDFEFVPASPAQGPFYELLQHSPEHGLPLIRRIVDHAIYFRTGGRDYGKNALAVTFPDGSEKVFPWYQSYGWPRDLGAGPSVVACALMALEAWAHGRIESGEPVERIVAEVIGDSTAPAAYLLVTVDLLLSHWPKSHAAAVPFVACPELLCLDRERLVGDNMQMPDIFGLKELQKEPVGPVTLETLKARPARRSALHQLLDLYAVNEEFSADRAALTELLQKVIARLGPPEKQSELGDPEFVVLHALNRIDPNNWRTRTVQTKDGPEEVWEYVPPAAESEHPKPLQDEIREKNANDRMQHPIRIALNNPSRSSPAFAAAAVKWAQEVVGKPTDDETAQRMREKAIVSAALIAARDGGADLIAADGRWIRETFQRAFKTKKDPAHRMCPGLQFNPIAIAFVGTALLLKNRFEMEDVRTLLDAAGGNPAAAQGFVAGILADIDERLPRAVLRCAFAASVQPWRHWDLPEEKHRARLEARAREVASAIEAEIAWLKGEQGEPEWPAFEPHPASSRHRYVIGQGRRERRVRPERGERYTDHQAAALWLGKAADIFDVAKRPWLRDLARTYSAWTGVANGAELKDDDDPERTPGEWNRAYFNLLARCLSDLTIAQIDELALKLILGLPGEAFLDVMATFVRSVDDVYFNGNELGDAAAVHIRTTLAQRLMETRQWKWQRRDRLDSISMRFGPALATLLFNEFGHFQTPKCYLLAKGIDRLQAFLPLLREIAENGSFLFVATTLLNLLEISPRPVHLPLICQAAKRWIDDFPDDREFWISQSIGRRVCSVIETILPLVPASVVPGQPTRQEIDDLLGKLIRLGLAEAHRLEESLGQLQ